MVLPVLVTITTGPDANAAFYVAWMISNFLRIIPIHLSTVLFAVASGDMRALRPKLRVSLRMSMLIGIPGMAVLCLGAPLLLGIFGASYARAGAVSLILLSLGYLPAVPKVHYIAVCRAQGLVRRAAALLSGTACLEIMAAVAGGQADGLTGLGLGVLAAYALEGMLTAPRVLRAAMPAGRHARR
jgi:O-antigen/teichoic acid export membrane protein